MEEEKIIKILNVRSLTSLIITLKNIDENYTVN